MSIRTLTVSQTDRPLQGSSATMSTIANRPIWDRPITGKALQDLLSRGWINRVWTFQELLLSPMPGICCGTRTVQWRSAVIVFQFLDRFRWMFASESPSPLLTAWTGMTRVWLDMYERDSVFLPPSVQAGKASTAARCLEKDYFTFIEGVYRYYRIMWNLSFCLLAITALALCIVCGQVLKIISSHIHSQPLLILGAIPLFVVMGFTVNSCLAMIVMIWYRVQRQLSVERFDLRKVIVNEIQIRRTTEARDKSFGVHLILTKLGVTLSNPDYSRSVEQIYKELFVSLLKWTNSANLLMCNSRKELGSTCSWVPNWWVATQRDSLDAAYLLGAANLWKQPINTETRPESREFVFRSTDELVLYGKPIARTASCIGNFKRTSSQYRNEEKPSHIQNVQTL